MLSLGFYEIFIDENLTWGTYINSKIFKTICIIYRAKSFQNRFILKQLYISFFHSHLSYSNEVCAGTDQSKLNPYFLTYHYT